MKRDAFHEEVRNMKLRKEKGDVRNHSWSRDSKMSSGGGHIGAWSNDLVTLVALSVLQVSKLNAKREVL